MMKKVNRAIAGMIMKRYVGDTGKKIFLTLPSALGLERAAVPVRWEGSAVAVMPAS
jgi:paraquat-inducible protein B